MLTKRRVTALLAAFACGITWVVLLAPGGAGRAASPIGTTVRASVADDGSQSQYGGGDSQVSGDGRFDIFTSYSSLANGPGNGTHPDTNGDDCECQDLNSAIYVRDLATGQTDQVSIGSYTAGGDNGNATQVEVDQPDGDSFSPSISANGRYISFVTNADNIVGLGRDENSAIVVCDRGAPNASGTFAATRAEGAVYPAYFQCVQVSESRFIVPTDVPHLDGAGDKIVWILDYVTEENAGISDTTGYVATLTEIGGQLQTPTGAAIQALPATIAGYPDPVEPKQVEISPDGDWVVYAASPEVPHEEGTSPTPTVVAEWQPGSTDAAERVDVNPSGDFIGNANTDVGHPDVSNGGTTVVFDSVDATYDYNTFNSYPDVYAVTVDTSKFSANGTAAVTTSSVVVSRVPDGTVAGTGGDGAYPTVSADGRYVGFVTDRPGMFNTPTLTSDSYQYGSSCLATSDQTNAPTNGEDLGAAARPATTSSASASAPASDASGTTRSGATARVNRPAADPPSGSGDPSGGGDRTPCQVAVRDLVADRAATAAGKPFVFAHLASPSRLLSCEPGAGQECLGDNDSENPVSLSDNGAQVGFDSAADDLVPNDTNAPKDYGPYNDAFVRTWTPSLTAGTLDFGDVQVGQRSDQSLTLTVSGFGPIPIGDTSIGGDDPGDFTIASSTCADTTVHAGDSCTVTIEFAPTTSGPVDGTVVVQPPTTPLVPDPDPIITVPVEGSGSATPPKHHTPQFDANTSTVYFGSDIPLHKPGLTRTITISNPGSGKLVLTHVSIVAGSVPGSSGDFTVSSPSCASGIQPGHSCTITVTFIGRAVGLRNASLRIADNTGGAAHVITLGGRIRSPRITVSPAVSPTGRVVTVTGSGFAPKRVVDIGFVQSGEETKVKADSRGRFSVGLVIFPNADEGPRTVTSRTLKVSPTISANTPLLVVLGTLESPTLVNRH